MKKKVYKIDSTTEIDWENKFGVKALNRDNRIFFPTSELNDSVIIIFENEDEFDVSDILANVVLWLGYDYDYALYNAKNLSLVGFVLDAETYDELKENIEDDIDYNNTLDDIVN